MKRKTVNELLFQSSHGAVPTVEVDLDTIQNGKFSEIVTETLAPIASADSDMLATVYTYMGPSINFGDTSYSAFLGIVGRESLLKAVHDAFSRVRGARVRYSDYIRPADCRCEYHIEDGKVWLAEDAASWYVHDSLTSASETDDDWAEDDDWSTEDGSLELLQSEEDGDEDDVSSLDAEGDPPSRQPDQVRPRTKPRAARSDASVASIRQKIERMFGLPEGSVALCGPDRTPLRGDAKIGTLRRRWE